MGQELQHHQDHLCWLGRPWSTHHCTPTATSSSPLPQFQRFHPERGVPAPHTSWQGLVRPWERRPPADSALQTQVTGKAAGILKPGHRSCISHLAPTSRLILGFLSCHRFCFSPCCDVSGRDATTKLLEGCRDCSRVPAAIPDPTGCCCSCPFCSSQATAEKSQPIPTFPAAGMGTCRRKLSFPSPDVAPHATSTRAVISLCKASGRSRQPLINHCVINAITNPRLARSGAEPQLSTASARALQR